MEDFVTYEVAKKLKGAGFSQDYGCYGSKFIYSDETTIKRISEIGAYDRDYYGEGIPCPTIAQAMKWLREEKKIVFGIVPMQEIDGDYLGWCITIYEVADDGYGLSWKEELYYDSYESAALAGIEYVLDNLI